QRVNETKEFIRSVTAASTSEVRANDFARSSDARWQSFSKTLTFRRWVWQGALAVLLLVALTGSWVLVRHFQNQRAERERLQNEQTAHRQQEEERARAVVPPANENRTELPGKNGTNVNNNQAPAGTRVTPAPVVSPPPRIANQQTAPPSGTQ